MCRKAADRFEETAAFAQVALCCEILAWSPASLGVPAPAWRVLITCRPGPGRARQAGMSSSSSAASTGGDHADPPEAAHEPGGPHPRPRPEGSPRPAKTPPPGTASGSRFDRPLGVTWPWIAASEGVLQRVPRLRGVRQVSVTLSAHPARERTPRVQRVGLPVGVVRETGKGTPERGARARALSRVSHACRAHERPTLVHMSRCLRSDLVASSGVALHILRPSSAAASKLPSGMHVTV